MKLTFKKHCLVFSFDEDAEINVIPDGENKYIVTFGCCDIQNKTTIQQVPSTVLYETQIKESYADKNTQKTEVKRDDKSNNPKYPTPYEVIEFLKSLENYTHNNSQIQEHFFGRALNSKKENYLYQRYNIVVRGARETIAEKEDGHWDENRVDLGNNRHLKTFTFIKNAKSQTRSLEE